MCGRAAVAREAHNLEVGSSNLLRATKKITNMAEVAIPKKTKKRELKEGVYSFILSNKIEPRAEGRPPYQPIKELPAIAEVFDEEKQTTRMMRYVKGYPSLWVDEQMRMQGYDAGFAERNAWKPRFIDGHLQLTSPQQDLMITSMFLRDNFAGNAAARGVTPVFDLVNKEVTFASKMDLFKAQQQAMAKAMEATYPECLPHATYLGIKESDTQTGQKKSPQQILTEYAEKAQADPSTFLKSFDSPVMKTKALIQGAIEKGIIDTGHVRGQAHWGETKALISLLDMSKDPADSLLEFSSTKTGQKFEQRLRQLMEQDEAK